MLRTREQLVALAPRGKALELYTMRFADEVVDHKDLDVPALRREPSRQEIEMAAAADRHARRTVAAVQPQGPLPRRRDGRDRAQGRRRGSQSPRARSHPSPRPTCSARWHQSLQSGAQTQTRRAEAQRARAPAKKTTIEGKGTLMARPRAVDRHPQLRPRRRARHAWSARCATATSTSTRSTRRPVSASRSAGPARTTDAEVALGGHRPRLRARRQAGRPLRR